MYGPYPGMAFQCYYETGAKAEVPAAPCCDDDGAAVLTGGRLREAPGLGHCASDFVPAFGVQPQPSPGLSDFGLWGDIIKPRCCGRIEDTTVQ